jgi:hypothetical protein
MRIAATMIDEITTSAATEDGRHVAFTLRDSSGNFVTLGLPSEKIPCLIDHAACALSEWERIVRPRGNGTRRFAVTWWNLLRNDRDGGVVLSLTFGGGGSLDFVLTGHMALCLMDTLRRHTIADTENSK